MFRNESVSLTLAIAFLLWSTVCPNRRSAGSATGRNLFLATAEGFSQTSRARH